jgi:sulfate transport system permease protein
MKAPMFAPKPRVLPGFGLSLGTASVYLSLLVLAPLVALCAKAAGLGWAGFWLEASGPRALASYRVTIGSAAAATAFNAVFGLLLAWILTRYRFAGRRLLDAAIDLPFALPTSVAGIALVSLFAQNGWLGRPLAALGVSVVYTPLGIAVAMVFTSLPFVVRALQPALADLDREIEEAAASLGATSPAVAARILWPALAPALASGCATAFGRSLGEYGAVIFIAGNLPRQTEVTSLLAYIRLEEFDYPSAATLSIVLMVVGGAAMGLGNLFQLRRARLEGRS